MSSLRSSRTLLALALTLAMTIAATVVFQYRDRWLPQRDAPLEANWMPRVLTLAGDGVAGTIDDEASRARFSDPFGVAVGADGTIYVADAGDAQRIRAVSPDGHVFTLAGGERGFADGRGAAARFNTPSGLTVDANGTLYVADTGNNAIRRITPDGVVSTIAGDSVAGDRDGPGPQARFNGPIGVAVDRRGRIIVADTYNDRIRAIDLDGTVHTLAGSRTGGVDGASSEARFHTPSGVAVDASGNIHVADTGNGVLRTIDPTGRVSTETTTSFDRSMRPVGITIGGAGERYVTDGRGRVLEISASGEMRPLAGSLPGFRDGVGREARFRGVTGVALDRRGRLVVADAANALIRLLADRSQLELPVPPSPRRAPHFDVDAFALLPLLWPVAPLEGPHEIAGTMGEARGDETHQRFHAGIDVRAEEGTIVHASRDGEVTSPIATADFGTLNESIRLGPITYVHIRAGRDRRDRVFDDVRFAPVYDDTGTLAEMRVKRGARFSAGEAIGSVNRFYHVHLNVGWPGEEHNPLRFRFAQFEDTVAPTIALGGVRLYDEAGQPLQRRVRGRVAVSGRVHAVVDAWDQSDGNARNRRLGVYDLGYQVLGPDGSPVPGFESVRHTISFDRLALDSEAPRLVYATGSGIPFYGQRRTRFLYIVTNSFKGGAAASGVWDTTSLPPGDYILRVWAADFNGNTAVANRDLPVTIEPATGHN
jgi:DNA-binding beta-propeller fold protein YncE